MTPVHSVGCAAPKSAKLETTQSEGEQDFSDSMEDPTQRDPSAELIGPVLAQPDRTNENHTAVLDFSSEKAPSIRTPAMPDFAGSSGKPKDGVFGAIASANQLVSADETVNLPATRDMQPKESLTAVVRMPVAQGEDDVLQQTKASQSKLDTQGANSERSQNEMSAASPLGIKPLPSQQSSISTVGAPTANPSENTHPSAEMNGDSHTEMHAHEKNSPTGRSLSIGPSVTPEPTASHTPNSGVTSSAASTDTAPIRISEGQVQANQLMLPEALTDSSLETSVRDTERADRVGLEAAPQPTTETSKTILRPATEQVRGISMQLTEAVQRAQDGSIDISLRPEELGRLRMSLQPGDGTMHVILQADRAETMDLLRRHIATLEQEFLALGYETFSFEFSSNEQPHSESAPESQDDSSQEDDGSIAAPSGPSPHAAQRYAGGLDLRV